jgi:hypothetical protein
MRALLILSLAAATVHASPAEEAHQHFEEGNKHFHLGAFYKAAEEYKLAYRAKPDPVLLYDAAQALRLAHEPGEAIFFYKSFLSTGPKSQQRHVVEQRIVELTRELEAQRHAALSVEPSPAPLVLAPPESPATAPTVTAPTAPEVFATQGPVLVAHPAPRRRRWWPWAVAGAAVVVGVALGVGLGVGLNDGSPKAATSLRF